MRPIFGRKYMFSTWQVEITTRCGLICKMCPKWAEEERYNKDMGLDDFKKISVYFPKVETVILEGWGESLLHPNLIDMIRIVKGKGSKVGFVTSGYGLNGDYILDLLRSGVDFIGFSFSGAKAETHESIRKGSNYEELKSNIILFRELAKRHNLKIPKMHVVYLLLKENMGEAPEIIKVAKNLGIEDVIFINIIHISSESQNRMKVFSYEKPSEYEVFLREAKEEAKKEKIRLITPSLSVDERLVCPENPLRSMYIDVDGNVSPCVYANPPTKSPFLRFFKDERYFLEKLIFGNLLDEPFERIWERESYREFRKRHKEREISAKKFYDSLLELKFPEERRIPPLPDFCLTCHKIHGF